MGPLDAASLVVYLRLDPDDMPAGMGYADLSRIMTERIAYMTWARKPFSNRPLYPDTTVQEFIRNAFMEAVAIGGRWRGWFEVTEIDLGSWVGSSRAAPIVAIHADATDRQLGVVKVALRSVSIPAEVLGRIPV